MKKSLALLICLFLLALKGYAATPEDGYGGEIKAAPVGDNVNINIVEKRDVAENVRPMKLQADKAEYNQDTGDFFAEGNVSLVQDGQTIKADYAEGNANTGDVFLKNGGELHEGNTVLKAQWVRYNFMKKNGTIESIDGSNLSKQEWYRAPNAVIEDGKVVCEDGAVISKCPSKKHPPCLSVEAKSLEVIPHEKMIAKDCWIKVRGVKVMHRDRWINYFQEKNHQTKIMPHIGWDDDNGMEYTLEVEQPLWNGGTVGGNFSYYSMVDWKPWYYVRQDAKDFYVRLSNGWDDDDGDWYKKQSNWEFKWRRHRLIKGLPFTYNAYFEHGLWQRRYDDGDYGKRSWHTEYGAYLYHDPIHFFGTDKNSLNLYIGKKWTRESLTDSHNSTNTYGATLSQKVGKHLMAWAGYYDERETSDVFEIGNPDMQKEVRAGLRYVFPSGKDVWTAVYRYDVQKGNRYEYDLIWLHHFCCWDLELTYEREFVEQKHTLRAKYMFNFM